MPVSPDRVHSVTTARTPRSEDQGKRMRHYVLAMSVRTGCFLAACVTANFTTGPLLWVFVVLAVVLPYVAVVIANATNYTIGSLEAPEPGATSRQLPRGGVVITLADGESSQP